MDTQIKAAFDLRVLDLDMAYRLDRLYLPDRPDDGRAGLGVGRTASA